MRGGGRGGWGSEMNGTELSTCDGSSQCHRLDQISAVSTVHSGSAARTAGQALHNNGVTGKGKGDNLPADIPSRISY